MSYFKLSCDYYIRSFNMDGHAHRAEIGRRCRAKYPRGVNLVDVSAEKQLGITFTPNFFVDPGRIFLNYERLTGEVFEDPSKIPKEIFEELKRLIDEYDPKKTIIWFFVLLHTNNAEYNIYTTDI